MGDVDRTRRAVFLLMTWCRFRQYPAETSLLSATRRGSAAARRTGRRAARNLRAVEDYGVGDPLPRFEAIRDGPMSGGCWSALAAVRTEGSMLAGNDEAAGWTSALAGISRPRRALRI